MTIEEKQEKIVEEFSVFDDWMDRYNFLIDLGKDLDVLSEKDKNRDYLIEGCQSKVWLKPDLREGRVYFSADSDAIITRGIVALLVRVLSGHTPAEIMDADLSFIDRIGLRQNLSPTRSNGLLAMVKQMKLYAIAYSSKMKG
ncbi:MAG: SufE family protein [Bacteroidales bacterium]|nr:SufE family protein [Bacteroidales bacterium]